MAVKETFIYRVEMGHHPEVKEIAFCYARNSSYAIYHMQMLFKDRHYNLYKAYRLGEADFARHPWSFELLPKDEEEYLRKIRSTVGETYEEHRHSISRIQKGPGVDGECRVPVSGQNTESVPDEGERIPDPGQ